MRSATVAPEDPEPVTLHLISAEIFRRLCACASLAVLLGGLGASAHAMEFSLTRQNPFTPGEVEYPALLMSGEIRPGDYERLLEFAARRSYYLPQAQVILASPGGDIEEALKIGKLVRKLYMTTSVGRETGYCASACFIIFASSVDRDTSPGLVGIHRPYLSREHLRSLSPSQAEAAETSALRDAEQYLRDLRVPRNLIDLMFEQASTEIHWLSEEEFMHQLGRRPAWYEEFLIARCRLDKVQEERLLLYGEKPPSYDVMAPVRCGEKLTIEEAKAAYGEIELDRMTKSIESLKKPMKQTPSPLVASPKWVFFTQSKSGTDAFFDETRIRSSGDVHMVWVKYVPPQHTEKGAGTEANKWLQYVQLSYEFDCRRVMVRATGSLANFEGGTHKLEDNSSSAWEPVSPEMLIVNLMNSVCMANAS